MDCTHVIVSDNGAVRNKALYLAAYSCKRDRSLWPIVSAAHAVLLRG